MPGMLIPIKQLILKAWDLYLDNFKKLLGLLGLLLAVNFASSAADLLIVNYTIDWAQMVWRVAAGAFFWCATILISIAFLIAINNLLNKQTFTFASALNQAAKKWWLVLLVAATSGLIIFGGFILFIIPGIIFAVWYNFSMYEALFQNTDVEQSLRHSHNLSRGRFWPVGWRLAIPNLFWSLILGLLAYSVVRLADQIFAGRLLAPTTVLTFSLLLAFITDVLSTLATPLFIATGLVLYHNLKETANVSAIASKE